MRASCRSHSIPLLLVFLSQRRMAILVYPCLLLNRCHRTIVVWVGFSSDGVLATQLAVASGAKVVTTASEHIFDLCNMCGATEVRRSIFTCFLHRLVCYKLSAIKRRRR
ncbi:hypothetical protein K431DRAFT_170342 [Polychaeton citri CBS 116435]|uniref:Alcohol dehydrogenase-like C-terminal domain-containing protein n=1 Tax=Polychaeton citri CBS 116435 TaxID=1314669 RepID=A0A9P4PZR3_9PEZI|nr:hypothetical protein K431DRAFT_170342 [Polychaeton citri CBS 116435]